jgi:ribosomal protein S21
MRVTVRNNNVNKALSIFRKKCSDKMLEVRERQRYEKPTTRRNVAKRRAIVNERKRFKAADGVYNDKA